MRKCLEKDRNRRYQSPRELLVDLQNLRRELEQESSTRPASTPARVPSGEGSLSATTESALLPASGATPEKSEALSMEEHLSGFEFFETDPETGRIREFDEALGPLLKQRFHERVYDLAHEVGQVLKILLHVQRQGATMTKSRGPRQIIYLATTTSELQNERDRIKRELIERGHTVLPDAPLPQVSGDIERAVEACRPT